MAGGTKIPFFTDEDVPDSVGDAILRGGHNLTRLRDAMLTGSPDPVVATACREGNLVLVTHNYRDFRRVSREMEATRRQFDRLHRIELRCSQVIAARRLIDEIELIEHVWARHDHDGSAGIRITIGDRVVSVARAPSAQG